MPEDDSVSYELSRLYLGTVGRYAVGPKARPLRRESLVRTRFVELRARMLFPDRYNDWMDSDAPREDAPAQWLEATAFGLVPRAKGQWGLLRADPDQGDKIDLVPSNDPFELADALARADPAPELGWSPESPYFTTVYEMEAIAAPVVARGLEQQEARLQDTLPTAGMAIAVAVGAALLWPRVPQYQMLIVLGMVFVWVPLWQRGVEASWDAWSHRKKLRTKPDAWRRAQAVRYRFWWLSETPRPYVAIGLIALFIVFFLASHVVGIREAVSRLGLLKPLNGDWWRLFTCAFLHGDPVHIGLNSYVAYDLARIGRRVIDERRLLIAFVVSVLCGSLASVAFTNAASIGASGGVLGWGGMLLAISRHHAGMRGSGLGSALLRWVVLLAIVGGAGASFIDNAAHAGGLLGGYAAGLWFIRDKKTRLPMGTNPNRSAWIGMAAIAALCAAAMLFHLLRR